MYTNNTHILYCTTINQIIEFVKHKGLHMCICYICDIIMLANDIGYLVWQVTYPNISRNLGYSCDLPAPSISYLCVDRQIVITCPFYTVWQHSRFLYRICIKVRYH